MATIGGPVIPGVTEGLILYLDAANEDSYPGTGTVWRDLSKSNFSGSLVNGPVYSGKSKDANFLFDGVNDYVNTSLNVISLNSLDMSMGIWFNTGTIPSNTFLIVGGANVNDNYQPVGFSISSRNSWEGSYLNNPGIVAISNWPRYIVSSPGSIQNNTWYYVVHTATPTRTQLFINGNLISTYNGTSTLYTGQNSYIGFGNYGTKGTGTSVTYPSNGFKGFISIGQIYNRALTASEVLQNYNSLKSRFNL